LRDPRQPRPRKEKRGARQLQRADHFRKRPPRPRPALRHRRHKDRERAGLESGREFRNGHRQDHRVVFEEISMINVTKSYLPDIEKYQTYIKKIYKTGILTNNGPLVQELEKRLSNYLGVKNVILTANGTIALEIAYKVLELENDIVTTPFSFVATTASMAFLGLNPVFSDIDPYTFNIDPETIEQRITHKTSAIVPVHVFGNACNVESIELIAKKHNLKIIYDAAHAFGVNYKGKSLLKHGDISILSFHATKIFHTIEGGAIITDNDELAQKVRIMENFGISSQSKIESIGTNGKMNEFEAAMGLCILDDMEKIIQARKKIYELYSDLLNGVVQFQKKNIYSTQNYSYFPILFKDEKELLYVLSTLEKFDIHPRRYFHPSLDTLPYIKQGFYSLISRDIASRVMCLPIYPTLNVNTAQKIADIIRKSVSSQF